MAEDGVNMRKVILSRLGPGQPAAGRTCWQLFGVSRMAWKHTSPASRGYGWQWQKLRKHMLTQEPLCRTCREQGRVTAATELDHIVPKSEGGTDDPVNLQCLCTDCHKDKTAHESARAQGRTAKTRLTFGADGWPVDACI